MSLCSIYSCHASLMFSAEKVMQCFISYETNIINWSAQVSCLTHILMDSVTIITDCAACLMRTCRIRDTCLFGQSIILLSRKSHLESENPV